MLVFAGSILLMGCCGDSEAESVSDDEEAEETAKDQRRVMRV